MRNKTTLILLSILIFMVINMAWTPEKLSVSRMERLSAAIPTGYTIFKRGSYYYGECNIPGGHNYGPVASPSILQDVIDAAEGYKIMLKTGTYPYPEMLTAAVSNIVIEGEANTILQLATGADTRFMHDTTTQENITFRNLIFDFNGENQSDGADREATSGITLENKTNVLFDTCTFKNTRSGAATLLKGCTNVWLRDCLYQDNGIAASAFICDHSYMERCTNVHISGGLYDTCSDVGTAFDNCVGVNVRANYSGNALAGFTWWNRDDDMLYPQGATFTGCYIDATDCQKTFYTGHAATESTRPEGLDLIGCHLRGGTVATGDVTDLVRFKMIGGSVKSGTTLGLNIDNVDGFVLDGVEISDVTTGIDFSSATIQYVRVKNCSFQGVTTEIDNPDTPTDAIYKDNTGFNPVGVITNPFGTGTIGLGGAAAIPTASTDYTILYTDVMISSTDSSNTDNAILIKDSSGTQVNQTALSTLEDLWLPIGWKINWGVFTGTAPTVTVAGN